MSVPRYWRNIPLYYRLEGVKCRTCGRVFFPPRSTCPKCGSSSLEQYTLPRRGRVLSFSVVRKPPRGFEYATPYVIALIELEDGSSILSQLTDCSPEEVEIGMPVEAVFRKVREDGETGIIMYGLKFRPVLSGEK